LLIWTIGYPLVALLGAVDGLGLGGRGLWLAGIALLGYATWRTRPKRSVWQRLPFRIWRR
jgi:hypothetical protein